MTDDDSIACCNQCKQALTEIDNRGERLTGCLTCNLWLPAQSKHGCLRNAVGLTAILNVCFGSEGDVQAKLSHVR
jgi:hypothetical protein